MSDWQLPQFGVSHRSVLVAFLWEMGLSQASRAAEQSELQPPIACARGSEGGLLFSSPVFENRTVPLLHVCWVWGFGVGVFFGMNRIGHIGGLNRVYAPEDG